jgi:primosomal replication protein N
MNQLQIYAKIHERDILRYSPAGIPIVSIRLMHESEQVEAGVQRQVVCEIAALAAGEIATQLVQLMMGQTHQFTGFLARKSRNSKSLVFHIIDIRALPEEGTF